MSKTMAESVEELDVAVANLGRVLVHELAASRVGRFLGWFYEWERPRIGDRLAKAATIILAANVLWLWPILIIEQALWAVGIGR